ncbi:MAG: penicillin-binding transpeptidase domain-containing protein [Hyphomicrobiales bacterium]
MRGVFLGAVVVGLLVGGVVAGVRAFAGDSDKDTGASSEPAQAGSPQATAAEWAHAWTTGDIDALYQLLTPAAQQATPLSLFREAYSTFETETTLDSLTAEVASAEPGRASLNVRAATTYFGDLEYTTTLNLEQTPARWLVSWDRTAIHPEMVGDLRIKSTIQRPTRGAILDRDGNPLAITQDVRMLGLNRALVEDRAALTAKLVAFGFTQEQVDAAFNAPGGPTQRVAVGPVSDDKAEQATTELRPIPGVLLYFESHRVHPLGPAAAHVVGYTRELTAEELEQRRGTGVRIGDRVGAVGLEAALEDRLAGKVGASLDIVNPAGQVVKTLVSQQYVPGEDVKTTLSSAVLQAAYQRLGDRPGSAVVIDPRTNEVLAINSSPSFDPDAFERNDADALAAITSNPLGPLQNRATLGLYSAGSTFKLITGAAGLAYGGYTPTDTIYCGATWDGVDPPRANWEGAQGPLTIAQGLMRSCNPVFYEIGLTLYKQDDDGAKLSEMARKFGFGEPTGILLPDEKGLVPDAKWKQETRHEPWYPGDSVNLAIGQGDLLITPLQLANAYSSFLAEHLRTPVILAGQQAEVKGDIPLTPEQFATLRQGLKLVTSASGTASAAFALAGYNDFLGKSGTAEDAGAQQHVLFVAASPADEPQAVCAIVLDDGESGSIEAGPIARDIVLAALQ